MMDESKLIWEVVKEEEITVPGGGSGGGPSKTKLSEFENDIGFITKEEIVDNLESDDPTKPLSARQGKVLFQSVSNGKNLIAAAITDKGVPATGGDSFTILANKIRQIETDKLGVGAASGSALVSTDTLPFVLRSGATVNMRYIEVSESFGFTPYIIFLRYSNYTYTFYNRYATAKYRISADAQNSRVSIDEAKMYVIQESSPAYVSSNGFLLPAYRSGVTYNWYAIGLV